jgi:hypothetical protein
MTPIFSIEEVWKMVTSDLPELTRLIEPWVPGRRQE